MRLPKSKNHKLLVCYWTLASFCTLNKKARSAAVIAANTRGRADRTHVAAVLRKSDECASTSKSLHAAQRCSWAIPRNAGDAT